MQTIKKAMCKQKAKSNPGMWMNDYYYHTSVENTNKPEGWQTKLRANNLKMPLFG